MMSYSLIIPIYNEKHKLKTLLPDLRNLGLDLNIIIIDDGSDDDSYELLKNQNDIKVIKNETNLGKGASITKALKFAKNDIVILMDGDLEVSTNDIPLLIYEFESQVKKSAVVGIRWNKYDNFNFTLNRIGNYFINKCFNLLYKTNMNDILCCYKIIEKRLIESFNLSSKGFSIETEIMAKLLLNQINIKEVKIRYKRRSKEDGKKIKFIDSWGILVTMIRLKFFK